MRGFIVGTATTAIAFFILTQVLPKYTPFDLITYKGELIGLVVLAVIFGIVNGLVGPIVRLLALPLSFMTLGLIGFVINGALLLITAWIGNTAGFDLIVGDYPPNLLTADTFVAAILGAVALSLVGTAVRMVVPD
jgi:putative membrane protein